MPGARSLTSHYCLETARGGRKKNVHACAHARAQRALETEPRQLERKHNVTCIQTRGARRSLQERGGPVHSALPRLPPPPSTLQWGWRRGEGLRAIVSVAVLLADPSLPLDKAGSSKGAALHRNMATANWGLERQNEKQTKGAREGGGDKREIAKRKGLSAEISAQSASDNIGMLQPAIFPGTQNST